MTVTTAAPAITAVDVKTFILTSATKDDLDAIFGAIKMRTSTLKAINAATVTVGAEAELTGLSPKYLNGLTGTVQTIRRERGDVLLDAKSTRALRYSGSRKYFIPADQEKYLLTGVPLSCFVIADATA